MPNIQQDIRALRREIASLRTERADTTDPYFREEIDRSILERYDLLTDLNEAMDASA